MKIIDHIFLLRSENRNQGLEGLRGLAVIMIFNVHFFSQFASINYFSFGNSFFEKLFGTLHSGMIGVDVFFVLSGFLVWRILFSQKRGYLPYLKGRIKRLMPAYVLNTIIIALSSLSFARLFYNIFFVPQFIPGIKFYNYVSWSLAWEWLFYLLLVSIAMISGRDYKKGLGLLLLMFVIHFFLSYFIKPTFILIPDCFRFSGFLIGCLLSQYHHKLNGSFFKIIGQLSFPFLFFQCYLWHQYAMLIKSHWLITGAYYLMADATAFLVINSLIHFTGGFSKILSLRFFRIMGQISYTFYLTHVIIIPAVSYWGLREVQSISSMLFLYAVTFSMATAVSVFFFYFTERNYLMSGAKTGF